MDASQTNFDVRLFRYDPSDGNEPTYDDYSVAGPNNLRILDILQSIYLEQAGDIAFQYSCRIGRCGTCAVQVNGRAVLACQETAKPKMTLEPLAQFEVLRDLVIDRTEMNETFKQLDLAPQRSTPHPGGIEAIDPEASYTVGEMGSCISCMICVSSCPAAEERNFDGPAFLLQLRRLAEHPADEGPRLEQAMESGLLECFGCDACVQVCPADLSPVDAIRSFRKDLLRPQRRSNRSDAVPGEGAK